MSASDADDRAALAAEMRRRFSPPGMVRPDGSINQDFFRPRAVITVPDKKWGDAERDLLYTGLERHGVGRWRSISEELLPGWDEGTLRVKAARLLGSQDLRRYSGRRMTRAEVQAELEANRHIGSETSCWKGGQLVEDDKGTLKAFLATKGAHKDEGTAGVRCKA